MDYKERVEKKLKEIKLKQDIYILSIESSCDETSVAIVKNGREVIVNEIASQIDIHTRFGGVVPEVASRNHIKAISSVYELALKNIQLNPWTGYGIFHTIGKFGYPHNIFLEMLEQGGVLYLFVWLIIILNPIMKMQNRMRKKILYCFIF